MNEHVDVAPRFYYVEGFKATGGSSTCNATSAWTPSGGRGATVTGVDFSAPAIAAARTLAAEMGVPATFVESNVYELPRRLDGQFDVVFTSNGVLNWLPDLGSWRFPPWMEQRPDGTWQLPGTPWLPLMFSLTATKPR